MTSTRSVKKKKAKGKSSKRKKGFTPMKKLILVANTPVDKLEEAIIKANKKLKEKGKPELNYMFLFGRAGNVDGMKCYNSDVVIFLGANAYKANNDHINPNAIGIMLDTPMNLACIRGPNLKALDYKRKAEGFGFFFDHKTPEQVSKLILKALKEKTPTKLVSVDALDYIPTIINAISDTVSFAQFYQALNYSVRNELTRVRIRDAFIFWVKSTKDIAELRKSLGKISDLGTENLRVDEFVKVFEANKSIRPALRQVVEDIKAKKNVQFDKLAFKAKISVFDLRYMAGLLRKNPLLLKQESSEAVHKNRGAGRFEETAEPVVEEGMEA